MDTELGSLGCGSLLLARMPRASILHFEYEKYQSRCGTLIGSFVLVLLATDMVIVVTVVKPGLTATIIMVMIKSREQSTFQEQSRPSILRLSIHEISGCTNGAQHRNSDC